MIKLLRGKRIETNDEATKFNLAAGQETFVCMWVSQLHCSNKDVDVNSY